MAWAVQLRGGGADEGKSLQARKNRWMRCLQSAVMERASRIHLPLLKPEDVIPHLGKGELHWRDGYSAKATCESWFSANDIPPSVRAVLEQAEEYKSAELLDAYLERKTHLPWGRGNPSQTDVLAILRTTSGLAVLGIEAKVKESFGPFVHDWLADGGENKADRLRGLCDLLGIETAEASNLRYQLLHRTVAAVLEAERYAAANAAMLVQSFCPDRTGFQDFQAFAEAAGFGRLSTSAISEAKIVSRISLRIGWAVDQLR